MPEKTWEAYRKRRQLDIVAASEALEGPRESRRSGVGLLLGSIAPGDCRRSQGFPEMSRSGGAGPLSDPPAQEDQRCSREAFFVMGWRGRADPPGDGRAQEDRRWEPRDVFAGGLPDGSAEWPAGRLDSPGRAADGGCGVTPERPWESSRPRNIARRHEDPGVTCRLPDDIGGRAWDRIAESPLEDLWGGLGIAWRETAQGPCVPQNCWKRPSGGAQRAAPVEITSEGSWKGRAAEPGVARKPLDDIGGVI